jgi:hypothetical protein
MAEVVDPEYKSKYDKKSIVLQVFIFKFFLDISMHVKHFRKSNI